jgi:hypothetical protein
MIISRRVVARAVFGWEVRRLASGIPGICGGSLEVCGSSETSRTLRVVRRKLRDFQNSGDFLKNLRNFCYIPKVSYKSP